MRIVHLPFYDNNPYQNLLMGAQRKLGHEVWEGGGGGNFIGVALREWKADLVHFHWLHPYLVRDTASGSILRATRFLVEVCLLKARGARIVWTIHNLVNHDGRCAKIERWFSSLFAGLCDAYYVHSHAAASAAKEQFGISEEKIRVIPHGHYLNVYPNELQQKEARERLSLPEKGRFFLFLGRVEPYKGVPELIQAFAGMSQNEHLLLAGEITNPDLLAQLSSECEECSNIHLYPERVADDELQVFFNAADVVVFPFRKVLTSGSIVLAMSFGKALVIPDLESLKEIVPEEGTHVFDTEKIETIGDSMKRWMEDDPVVGGEFNLGMARQWDWQEIARMSLDGFDR